MTLIWITCHKRALDHLVDALSDWQSEGVKIARYGYSNKANDGFILMRWPKEPSEGFLQHQLYDDPDILDFVACRDLFTTWESAPI